MVIGIIFPFSLICLGFFVLRFTKLKMRSVFEQLSISYILSLTVIMSLLYLGGIVNAFNAASFIVLALVAISFVFLLALLLKNLHSPHQFKTLLFSHASKEKLIIGISIACVLSVYAVFLSSRAILDSDVVQDYLPISREIFRRNGFTYSNGYDYNILLKPIGGAVIYAWTYVVNGSMISESFRFLPLAPTLVLIALNYAIAFSATKSKIIAMVSTAVFLVLPFNDRFLLYSAFYPDVFYYPLIFAAIYFLLEYSQSKQNSLLLFTGIGLGIAGLFKAQTVYIFIAFALVLLVLEVKHMKKVSAVLCCLAPFYILIPSILASNVQNKSFHLSVPSFDETQLLLLFFLSGLSVICLYVTMHGKASHTNPSDQLIKGLFRKTALLLIPFAVLSSLWYVNNFFRFGTFLSTSSINLPNFDWALEVLKPLVTAQQTPDIWHHLVQFAFVFIDPAVMGYVMLVPFLIGLHFVLRNRMEDCNVLLLFEVISLVVILSTVVVSLPSATSYNPRDIFVLAPLVTTLSAVGIVSATSKLGEVNDRAKTVFVSISLVAYFGLLNYIHSVLVWFTSEYTPTAIGGLVHFLGRIVGLTLTQTSYQITYEERAVFAGDNILRIAALSLLCGIPVLLFVIFNHRKLLVSETLRSDARNRSRRELSFAQVFILLALLISVILLPRAEMLLAQGGPQGIGESQLKRSYGALYELVTDRNIRLDGAILTYGSPMGLAYYVRNVKILDLVYPANLAFLKNCLLSESTYETVINMKQQGIKYLLINPVTIKQFDASLNFTISKIIHSPELVNLSRTFESWRLYNLGPYKIEKTSITLSGWEIDPKYTEGSNYALSHDEAGLSLVLEPKSKESRLTIVNYDLPRLNLSDWDYVIAGVDGEMNSRALLRFWLTDGTGFDAAYWSEPYIISSTMFSLSPYYGKTLSGEAYIGFRSSDEMSSSMKVQEISFIKIREILMP